MINDPCLRCVLPDCDDRSPRCLLRRGWNAAQSKKRNGESLTDHERMVYNAFFHLWDIDRSAEAAEGGRPYKRWADRTAARRQREQAGIA